MRDLPRKRVRDLHRIMRYVNHVRATFAPVLSRANVHYRDAKVGRFSDAGARVPDETRRLCE
jgi:hypothetical protein